jgi:hydroxymethylglutaryl-CoA lyase
MPWPNVVYSEEVMREGFGIEDARIPLEARLALIEALSETGLKRITLGAFVSPRFVPQMACFEELLRRLRPRNGVKYLAFIHNEKARQLAEQYAPPLTVEAKSFALFIDVCDIHQRRNVNRSIEQAMAGWPDAVMEARERGVTEAGIGIASAWGSNFSGKFTQRYCMSFLERQADLLESAGIAVTEIALHDSQSWCVPHEMEQYLVAVRNHWPKVRRFHFHMHNARGMALPSIYAALRNLAPEHTVLLEGTLGGIGGGQYCGNGTASGMAATEDLLHMLEGMGIETGVDLDKIIDCVWMLERTIGRAAFGAVSRAGPRPSHARLYDPNLPAIESTAAARHFKLGGAAYETEGYSPWRQPISGPFWQGLEAPLIK